MKIFRFCFTSTFFGLFFLDYSNAECIKTTATNATLIECETKEIATYKINGLSEKKSKTSFIPTYTDKNVYTIVEITGINISSHDHILNIGNSQNRANPRMDLQITTLNNKVGNETINIYGFDTSFNPSSLYVTNLKNNFGNLAINGEIRNNVTVEKATIFGDLSIDNINANMTNLSVKDIYLSDSILNLGSNGTVDINNINSDANSSINISSNGKIGSINSTGDIIFLGQDTIIQVGNIASSKDIILKNNIEVIVDEILKNNKMLFLGKGKLISDELKLKEIIIEGSDEEVRGKNNIEITNDIISDNMYIKNIELDLLAKGINIKDNLYLKNTVLNIQSDLNATKMDIETSVVKNDNNLVISDLVLNNSSVRFKNIKIGNSVSINKSLLNAEKVDFISFKEKPNLTIDITDNSMLSQGSLKSGIYSNGDVNISNNISLNLLLMDSNVIKQGESYIYEIIYSKNGEINYKPNSLFLNGETGILDINYYLIQEKGSSFVAEITRVISYCEAILGINCNSSSKIISEDTFVTDTVRNLDEIIEKGLPVSDNLSRLIGALDQSSLEKLEDNIISLKPVSNDVLLFENYNNSKFIKDISFNNKHQDKDYNFSIFSSQGKIEDNIFKRHSKTKLLGFYYGASFYNDLSVGLAFSKSEIDSNLYKVDNLGILLLSSYDLKLNYINLDFMGAYGINKYDRNKTNFNNSSSKSSSMLNNISFRTTVYNDYFIKDMQISPKFYYDVSYLRLGGYKERGDGYLYEVLSSRSLINEVSAGIDLSNNIINGKALLSGGFNIVYLSYSSNNTQANPYETTSEYIEFGNDNYSGFGLSAQLGINYTLNNNMEINFSYNGSLYKNNTFFNGLVLSLKL